MLFVVVQKSNSVRRDIDRRADEVLRAIFCAATNEDEVPELLSVVLG